MECESSRWVQLAIYARQRSHHSCSYFLVSSEITTLTATAREFCLIIQERDVAAWPEWQSIAAATPLPSFAEHLCRDEAAFLAALQQPWSNRPVGGGLSKPLGKFVSQRLYGIQYSQDVTLSNIGRALGEAIPLICTEKRLSRNLKHAELET
jgi:hypothetical protein